MTIAIGQDVIANVFTGNTAATATLTSTATGSLLVAVSLLGGSSSSITSVTDSNGQTWTQTPAAFSSDTGSNRAIDIWYKANSASGVTSVTATPSGNANLLLEVFEITGAATSSPVDAVNTISNHASTTSMTTASITTTASGDLILAYINSNQAGGQATAPYTPTARALNGGYYIPSGTVSGSTTTFTNAASTYCSSAVAFLAASSGNITVNPTGVSATGAVGTPTGNSPNVSVTGVSATGAVGTPTVSTTSAGGSSGLLSLKRFWGARKPPLGSQINQSHPLAKGLVGCWLLNEGGGNKVYDLSGNHNTGTINGSPAWGASPHGPDVVGNGSNVDISFSSSTNIPSGGAARTLCTWINNFSLTGTNFPGMIDLGAPGTDSPPHFIFEVTNISGTVYLFSDGVNGANNITLSGSQIPSTNAWHFLVMTMDANNNWAYYLDGIKQASGTFSVAINTGVGLTLLSRNDAFHGYRDAAMDSAFIYNRALSATEVQQLYTDPFCFMSPQIVRLPIGTTATVTLKNLPPFQRWAA